MKDLLIINSKNNKQILYKVKYNFDLNNKNMVNTILKSLSGVYKESFDTVKYI